LHSPAVNTDTGYQVQVIKNLQILSSFRQVIKTFFVLCNHYNVHKHLKKIIVSTFRIIKFVFIDRVLLQKITLDNNIRRLQERLQDILEIVQIDRVKSKN